MSEPGHEGREELTCPSDNVISTRYRCKVSDTWTDCSRQSCCPGYSLVLGRCVSNDVDPCSLGLCQQRCDVYFGRVVCTCHAGYKFNAARYREEGAEAACEDVDECGTDEREEDGVCSQVRIIV